MASSSQRQKLRGQEARPSVLSSLKSNNPRATTLWGTQHPTHEAPEVDGLSILYVQVGLGPTKAGDDRLAAGK